MADILFELASNFEGGYFRLTAALALAGFIVLLLNTLSHVLVESLRERSARRSHIERSLHPVLGASADLISRIADILVAHPLDLREQLIGFDRAKEQTSLTGLSPLQMSRHVSTAFRLVKLLALALRFDRQTSDTSTCALLEKANYFLQHKLAVALRGHLYRSPQLSTEAQEEVASSFLRSIENDADDLTVGRFCKSLRDGSFEPELFVQVMALFVVDAEFLTSGRDLDRNNENWRRILTLAHLAVYLIDFFQDFEKNSQWEEERVLFVRLIRQWNADSSKSRYLYEPGDLASDNYVDTFPGRLAPPGMALSLVLGVLEWIKVSRWLERFAKRVTLNIRGARFRRRHDTKRIRPRGVVVKAQSKKHELRYDGDLKTLYLDVQTYLKSRLA